MSHDDPAFAFLQSFPGTINAGFTGGEGLAVIGDSLYLMSSGANTIVELDISAATGGFCGTTVPTSSPWAFLPLMLLLVPVNHFGTRRRSGLAA